MVKFMCVQTYSHTHGWQKQSFGKYKPDSIDSIFFRIHKLSTSVLIKKACLAKINSPGVQWRIERKKEMKIEINHLYIRIILNARKRGRRSEELK